MGLNNQASEAKPIPMRVLIIGAGPSGLLLAHYLLEKGGGRFTVSIHEAREDPRVTMKRPPTPRRYSLGVTPRGKAALDQVDGLWAAVKAAGVQLKLGKIWLFGRLIKLGGKPNSDEAPFVTDRTALCAAMLELLTDRYGNSDLLEVHFNQSCSKVDLDARCAHFSDVRTGEPLPIDQQHAATGIETAGVNGFATSETTGVNGFSGSEIASVNGFVASETAGMDGIAASETAGVNGFPASEQNGMEQNGMPGQKKDGGGFNTRREYDLLVGADGVRSVVRNGIMQHLRSFDYEQRDLGSQWLVANIPVPPATEYNWMVLLGSKPGGLGGLLLPSTLSIEGKPTMCLVLGWQIAEPPEPWLALQTAHEAKQFLERNLPWLQVPLEAAESLVTQRPSRSMQVKCSQYHDADGRAVLMGDAAHSTSPSIGQGCNTSLADAAALGTLLCSMIDGSDLPRVLEQYTALRVPEGHALVDLSESQAPMKASYALGNAIRMMKQSLFHALLPKVFPKSVMAAAGTTEPLAQIYRNHKARVDAVLKSNKEELKKLAEKQAELAEGASKGQANGAPREKVVFLGHRAD